MKQRIYSEFFDDMTYQSEAFFDERIEWCWIDRDDSDGQSLHEYLQVRSFLLIVISILKISI
jgi:hypothetical protein